MRIAWISYVDPFVFSGGGELHNRLLIEVGRSRGHEISVSSWLRRRAQRGLRRAGLHRQLSVDWSADVFVLANVHNAPQRSDRIPAELLERVLASGNAVLLADAWVDVCAYDMPCAGDPAACPPACDRTWAESAYARARAAVFVSPMQRSMIEGVLRTPLPPVVYSRPQIDVSRFRELGLERDIDVLYVGTIKKAKGYDELLARFGAERLTFAGPSVLDEPVAGTWLGAVDYADLPELYNRARIFAHLPRWHEPMGRTVVEAALCGCELELNERVGVRSYPERDWRDPDVVGTNATRFWDDFERVLAGGEGE